MVENSFPDYSKFMICVGDWGEKSLPSTRFLKSACQALEPGLEPAHGPQQNEQHGQKGQKEHVASRPDKDEGPAGEGACGHKEGPKAHEGRGKARP